VPNLRHAAAVASHPRANRDGAAMRCSHGGMRTAAVRSHHHWGRSRSRPRKECARDTFDALESRHVDRRIDVLMFRCGSALRRNVRQKIAEDALVGMDRCTVRMRLILDVVAQPLRHARRQQLRLANHGERRRSHVDDGEYREEQAAEAGEPVHAQNVRLWEPVMNPQHYPSCSGDDLHRSTIARAQADGTAMIRAMVSATIAGACGVTRLPYSVGDFFLPSQAASRSSPAARRRSGERIENSVEGGLRRASAGARSSY
jgi:hypothetical protein